MKYISIIFTAIHFLGASVSASAEESFYKLNPPVLGYGVPIAFEISDAYFKGLRKRVWAGGRKSYRKRDEWIMFGNGHEAEQNFSISFMQRTPANQTQYGVRDIVRRAYFLKRGNFKLHRRVSIFPTAIGNFEIVLLKYRYHHIKKICIVFSSNHVDKRLFVSGHFCGGKELPHPYALRCTLESISSRRFDLAEKRNPSCNGKIPENEVQFDSYQQEHDAKPAKRGFEVLTQS